MKLLIGTPAYGGMLFADYLVSMITSVRGFIRDNVDFVVQTVTNESLISRGRNTIANQTLDGGYDKLLFIDADMGWTYDDLCAILNSDKPIVGGTYPLKVLPISLNFNPMPDHCGVFETDGPEGKMYHKTLDKFAEYKQKYAAPNGEVEVIHAPAGFLAIHTNVFKRLKEVVNSYQQRDFRTGKISTAYEFFPMRIKNNVLESEDWAFCSIAREAGIPIFLNTNVILSHSGTHTFKK